MTRSILMYERYYHEGEARQYHLQYYLLIDQVTFGCNSLDIYGAKVLAFCNGEYLDQKVIRGITPFGPGLLPLSTGWPTAWPRRKPWREWYLACPRHKKVLDTAGGIWYNGENPNLRIRSFSMKCPYCGDQESKVVDSRRSDDGLSIRRRRECLACQKRFTTYETVESLPVIVVKKDGSRQAFNRDKILNGIVRACEKRPVPQLPWSRRCRRLSKLFKTPWNGRSALRPSVNW